MTLARIQQTGKGRLKARAAIEGHPYQFVSSRDMVQAGSPTTQARALGLDVRSLKFGAKGDLMRARLSADPCDVSIQDIGGIARIAFGKKPQIVAYLAATLAVGDVTATVKDTTGYPSSGVFHVGTEAILYSGKTGTTFTGLTRGAWGTTEQAHFVADGAKLTYPRVTEIPESLEGRRVLINFYGDGDDPQGDGTLVWRGIATTGAKYSRGVWSYSLDPITRILDGEIGAGINDPCGIRGIYYPLTAPLLLSFSAPNSISAHSYVRLTGFFATQQEFCNALTSAIAAAFATPTTGTWSALSAGSSVTAQPAPNNADGTAAWELVYAVGTGAGTVMNIWVDALSTIDGVNGIYVGGFGHGVITWTMFDGTTGGGQRLESSQTPTAGQLYYIRFTGGDVPRAGLGRYGGPDLPALAIPPTDPAADGSRVYLNSLVQPVGSDAVVLSKDGDPAHADPLGSVSFDPSIRALENILCRFKILGRSTTVTFGNKIAQGTVEDFRLALIADSPGSTNAGSMPLVTSTDILSLNVAAVAPDSELGSNRLFVAFPGTKLSEVIEPELLVLGCIQRLNVGAIEWLPLRIVAQTDAPSWIIGEGDFERDTWPTWERGADGIISTVEYKTGWNPATDKWDGRSIFARDVESASGNRTAISIEVAQRSYPLGRLEGAVDDGFSNLPVAVANMAYPLLSFFGAEYDRIGVVVGMRYFGAKIGDTVRLTSGQVPNVDGTMGVSGEVCLVTGHSFDASTMRVSLELFRPNQAIAGYAPGFRVTAQTNISGNTWDVVVNLSDYTNATDIQRWLKVGDLMRVTQIDSTTPAEVNCSVLSFTSANTVRVLFVSAWTPSASEWAFRARDASAYASGDTLAKYFFVANTARKIAFSDVSLTADVLAP